MAIPIHTAVVAGLLAIGMLLALMWPLVARAMENQETDQTVLFNPPVTTEVALIAPTGMRLGPKEQVTLAFLDVPVMVRIASAESGFDPTAKNPGSTAKGLFQILDGTWSGMKCTGRPFNPTDNIACAKKLYEAQGTNPWLASKDKWE